MGYLDDQRWSLAFYVILQLRKHFHLFPDLNESPEAFSDDVVTPTLV